MPVTLELIYFAQGLAKKINRKYAWFWMLIFWDVTQSVVFHMIVCLMDIWAMPKIHMFACPAEIIRVGIQHCLILMGIMRVTKLHLKRIFHHTEVTWASWRLKSPARKLIIQQIPQANNNKNTKAPHCWSLIKVIYRGGMPHRRPIIYILRLSQCKPAALPERNFIVVSTTLGTR